MCCRRGALQQRLVRRTDPDLEALAGCDHFDAGHAEVLAGSARNTDSSCGNGGWRGGRCDLAYGLEQRTRGGVMPGAVRRYTVRPRQASWTSARKQNSVRHGLLAVGAIVVTALLVGPSTGDASAAPASMKPFTAVGPGGVHLHAWASSAGRRAATLIVINGGPGFSHLAEPPAGVLAPQFRVVVYDQRGTGLSRAAHDRTFDLSHQVGDLEALRRRLGAQRVDLLGHSWGGLIAAAYAARYPQRAGALVLADAEPADATAAARGFAFLTQRIAALMVSGLIPSPLPPVVGDDCSAHINAYTPAYLANPKLRVPLLPRGACSEATFIQTNAALTPSARKTVLSELRRYHGRALIIFGREDPFRAAFQAPDVAELSTAHVQLKVLPHAGHLVWAESPQFFPIVRTFLST